MYLTTLFLQLSLWTKPSILHTSQIFAKITTRKLSLPQILVVFTFLVLKWNVEPEVGECLQLRSLNSSPVSSVLIAYVLFLSSQKYDLMAAVGKDQWMNFAKKIKKCVHFIPITPWNKRVRKTLENFKFENYFVVPVTHPFFWYVY